MEQIKHNLDYFHANEAEQFTFFRIPKALFSEERYKYLSSDAKILYGLLLDRMGLSLRNEWLDDKGRVYVYYSVEEIKNDLNRSHNKTIALYKELTETGLIIKKRQGLGKPDRIYVMNFSSGINITGTLEFPKSEFQNSLKGNSGILNIGSLEFPKSDNLNSQKQTSLNRKNKTYINDTELSKTSSSGVSTGDEDDGKITLPSIDMQKLNEASRLITWKSSTRLDKIIDHTMYILYVMYKENNPDNRSLLEMVNTDVLIRYLEEVSELDFNGVNNITAYLRRVLLEFLRKIEIVGTVKKLPEASYDLREMQKLIDEGSDYLHEIQNFMDEGGYSVVDGT